MQSTTHSLQERISSRYFVAVLLLAFFFSFWNLGAISIHPEDESLHVSVIQRMLDKGDILIPHDESGPYFNKPPLKMWTTYVLLKSFGESPFTYRFLDALCGVITFLATYFFAVLVLESNIIGFFAVLFLGSAQVFLFDHGIRSAVQDSTVVCSSTIAFLLAFLYLHREKQNIGLIYGLSLCTAIALCTKSAAGLLTPGIIFLYWLFFSRRKISVIHCIIGAILAVTPLVLYFLWVHQYHPNIFKIAFKKEVLYRVTRGFQRTDDYLFYLNLIYRRGLAISSISLLLSFIVGAWAIFCKRNIAPLLYLITWSVLPFIVFSFASTRLEWYIIPAIPGQALLCSWALVTSFRERQHKFLMKIIAVAIFFGLLTHLYYTTKRILHPKAPIDLNVIADTLSAIPQEVRILSLEPLMTLMPARFERVHLRIAATEDIKEANSSAEVESIYSQYQPTFLIGKPEEVLPYITSGKVFSFVTVPPLIKYPKQHQRKNWLVLASLIDILPSGFSSTQSNFSIKDASVPFTFPATPMTKQTGLQVLLHVHECSGDDLKVSIEISQDGNKQKKVISCEKVRSGIYEKQCRISTEILTELLPTNGRILITGCNALSQIDGAILMRH